MKVNRAIKILIISDFFILGGMYLITPIFAIFLASGIEGGSIAVAGYAAAAYWIPKSLLQIPIGYYYDRIKGEKDDFYCMVIGTMLMSIVPFLYVFARVPWHIYVFQIIYAVGAAFSIPAWGGFFVRHIDKGFEACEWGMESTTLGLSAGLSGAGGGYLAQHYGFDLVFILAGLLIFIGALTLVFLYSMLKPRVGDGLTEAVKIKRPK